MLCLSAHALKSSEFSIPPSGFDSLTRVICVVYFSPNSSDYRYPKAKVPLRYASASCVDLRRYYADFLWSDYCFYIKDPSLCAEQITEVIVSGMEAYILHPFS
ncbi:hypothetical protein E2C01_058810 [Portunus trituberculatus]|uniref:Uncharacterized protein n=1 Tax=Portunus trituberculatus TaxID=210409 RepID=A0A5B7GXF4_PORTR|nr:hypothetical protein [Portunus trituberculatus]